MGDVMVIAKLYPEGPEEVSKVEEALKDFKEGKVQDIKKEPLAFGLELIRVGIVVPDKTDGAVEKVEQALAKLPGVNQVEVEGATLI